MLSLEELQQLQRITSAARLSSYSRFLGTANAEEAYGAYMWSTAVSAAFSPIIQAMEIAYRNSLNEVLSAAYGPDWFQTWVVQQANSKRQSNTFQGQSEGERLIEKAKKKVKERDGAENRRQGLARLPANYRPGWQSVLAELTFGFWVHFLTRWFWDVNSNTKLWPNHLSKVFPGTSPSMHAVGALHKALDEAVDMRNRIHHQEPLWKHYTVGSPNDAVQYLSAQLNDCLKKLDYFGPAQRSAMHKYGVISAIEELCSLDTFYRFIGRSHGQSLSLDSGKRPFRLIEKHVENHVSVWVTCEAKLPKFIIRNANRRFF